jgi:hypothetical protein
MYCLNRCFKTWNSLTQHHFALEIGHSIEPPLTINHAVEYFFRGAELAQLV